MIKIVLTLVIGSLITGAIFLWLQTPDLFEYFNQAFCSH